MTKPDPENGHAMAVGIIPGLGHLYRGRFVSGLFWFLWISGFYGMSLLALLESDPLIFSIFAVIGVVSHLTIIWGAGR